MDSWTVATLEIAVATGLVGVIVGGGWAYWRSTASRRRRAGRLTALKARLNEEKLRASHLEAELHAQRARAFALERELEARESDWAQSSPTPFSFDAQTFQIDRLLLASDAAPPPDAERVAGLERQVRDLQDLLAKVTTIPRSSRKRTRTPKADTLVEEVLPGGTEAAS
jgi:hypothetical protein